MLLQTNNPGFLNQALSPLSHFPFVAQVAIIIIAISLVGWLFSSIAILLKRRSNNKYNRLREQLLPCIDVYVLEKVVSLSHPAFQALKLPERELRALWQTGRWINSRRRQVFVDYLQEMSENLGGKANLQLKKIYTDLDLNIYAAKRLSSWNTWTKLLALKELVYFEALDHGSQVELLIKSKNGYVREKTLAYILKTYTLNIFDCFEQVKEHFTKWEHLAYFEIISNRKGIEMPEFFRYIGPGYHRSVNMLSLDLIVHFHQFNAVPVITKLLQTETMDEELKCKFINSLGKLFQPEALGVVQGLYTDDAGQAVKHELLKALGRIGDNESLLFLKKIFLAEESLFLKKHAARSIFSIDKRAIHSLMSEAQRKEEHTIIRHVTNPLLKF